MTLTLTVLRCPDAVHPETRHITGGELRIGRGPDNDWVLSDPERHLSKRHCIVAFHQGSWAVADISTNGTFVNDSTTPLGHGTICELSTGDRIRLGTYEIEVQIAPVSYGTNTQSTPYTTPDLASPPLSDDPFADALFAPQPPAGAVPTHQDFLHGAFGNDDPLFGDVALPDAVTLPDSFSTPAHPSADYSAPPALADHLPAFGDAFAPPEARPLLPDDDDWDLSPLTPPEVPPAAHNLAPAMAPPHSADPFFLEITPGNKQETEQNNPFIEPTDGLAAPVIPVIPAPQPHIPTAAPVLSAGVPDLMSAFLTGAGVADMPQPTDPAALMHALGATFRAMVTGLRQTLIARATIKGEFRIEQTMIRAKGNNPLKFSAHDDDALCALLGLGRRVDMQPDAAVRDTLRDIRLHELATMAAMQNAVNTLIARLDPTRLKAEAESAGGLALLPAQKKARAFESFEKEYKTITAGLNDNFDAVFGHAFASAYEAALHDIKDRDTV